MKNLASYLLASLVISSVRLTYAADLEPGLNAEYFDLGSSVEDFPKLEGKKPALKRVDKTINFRSSGPTFPGTKLDNHFAIRWTGKIKVPEDGTYTFYLESDDGSRLLIDGKQVVDNGGLHEMQEQDGKIELKAGEHEIRIDYFENENDGGAGCVLSWKTKTRSKEVVPATALFHEAKEG
jgi:PA14 domain